MRVIENELLRVTINEFGAELTSIRSKKDDSEYIWQADPTIWKRHAPLLFPIVGRLKDKSYTVGGRQFSITQHGFARDLPFEAVEVSRECVEFVLTQNEKTLEMYPFRFTFTVRYSLEGNTLRREHIVQNDDTQTMYYEIGGHDAFNLCLGQGEHITDYYAEFEGDEILHPLLMDENLMLTQKRGLIPLSGNRLYLNRETFRNDAVILDELSVRRVTIGNDCNEKRVQMEFADFPYFALWSAYKPFDVPYLCLEPWSSLPDCSYLGSELEQKVGVRVLGAGDSENLSLTITILE